MFAVTVELLAGRYVATQFNDRSKTEWPPHPARLFSAAVAAWADHGDLDDAERAALEWWETLEPPTISCSLGDELAERHAVTHFVPVNDTSVVARDTSRTYEALVAAESDLAAVDGDDTKALTKATTRATKARLKALDDSQKATSGVAPDDRLEILPERRGKQARMFPTVVPADPTVTYHWATGADEAAAATVESHLTTLDGLLARIPRLGHSSTPVSIAVTADIDPSTTVVALEPGTARLSIGLRVPTEGQVENLIRAYEGSSRGTEPRTMPARIEPYRRPADTTEPPASTVGGRWILLETVDRRFGIRDVAAVARTLRAALMSVAGEHGAEIPEVLSGHQPRSGHGSGETAPSTRPHLMVLGLPFAARRHATGEVLGFAVVVPDSEGGSDDPEAWEVVRRTVDRFIADRHGRLTFKGGARPATMRRADVGDLPEALQITRWRRASRRWASVTPVALSRNPGQLGHQDPAKREAATAAAEESVADACEHIGLPRPAHVEITLDAPVIGTRPVHAFPPARTGRLTRVQVHAQLVFDVPVEGPIVLGAGRFQGLGLFTPLADRHLDGSEDRS